ncbi:MAG: hypothetical protein SFV81_14245 [Pirellulaceae bacterium]|nr:hypothetical protein [Pirellulaceae bacterium]
MKRSTSRSRLGRRMTFEALQTRELMAFDSAVVIHEGLSNLPTLSAGQFATRILDGYENSQLHIPNQPLDELKKFTSETDAQKFLTDALLKAWQDLLGKSVNNQLFQAYPNNIWNFNDAVSLSVSANVDSLPQTQTSRNSTNNQVHNIDEADQFEVSSDGMYTQR